MVRIFREYKFVSFVILRSSSFAWSLHTVTVVMEEKSQIPLPILGSTILWKHVIGVVLRR